MSVSLKKGSTMIVIMLTLLACFLMGCSISHLPDHPDFPVPAPLATDITTISENLDTTATFTSFSGIKWFNRSGDVMKEQSYTDVKLAHPINVTDDSDKHLIIYFSDDKQTLVNLHTGEQRHIIHDNLPEFDDYVGNDIGVNLIYSSQWSDLTYFTLGNRYVIKYDTMNYQYTLIYEAPSPIYSISSSPDQTKVSLLVSSDDSIGAFADLIVLDEEGQIIEIVEQHSYYAKSDGFLFLYPMEWQDDETIVTAYRGTDTINEVRYYNLNTKTLSVKPDLTLTDSLKTILQNEIGTLNLSASTFDIYPLDDELSSLYVIRVDWDENYIINTLESSIKNIGKGRALHWISNEQLVFWSANHEHLPNITVIDY